MKRPGSVPSAGPSAELRRLAESLRSVLHGSAGRGESGGRGKPGAGLEAFLGLVALRCLDLQSSDAGKLKVPAAAELKARIKRAQRLLPDEPGLERLQKRLTQPVIRRATEMLWDASLLQSACLDDPGAPGWLYQYWVNCDKPRVAAKIARKAGDKISGRDLVSATCIYTQPELAKFLVQNTVGARWAAANPGSPVLQGWSYLVAGDPATPRVAEHLAVFDPACGAGHMLLEAFEVLLAAHRAERPDRSVREICRAILAKNLFGVDIDPHAVRVARLCLTLRCLQLDPGYMPGRMNIYAFGGKDAVLGSLTRRAVNSTDPASRLLLGPYDAVVTNPPFVGFRKLATSVKSRLLKEDPLAASDLAVAFVSRCHSLLADGGRMGIVAPATWMTSSPAAPLRRHLLSSGGPVVVAHLGQHVFETAPLLFVSLAVVERSDQAQSMRVIRSEGGGASAMREAVRDGGDAVKLGIARASTGARFAVPMRSLISRPFIPLGELFIFVDGVWSGDNARDVREASAVAPGDQQWLPASGGQGYRRWYAPICRRVRASVAARWPWMDRRTGCLEYARVAGGKLAARMVTTRSAAIAGVVTMVPKVSGRELDALAVMNSRAGTLFLRRLVSGLNFNPGYAAQVPVPEAPIGIGKQVQRAIEIVRELARLETGCDDFVGCVEDEVGLRRELDDLERWIDLRVLEALGMSEREVNGIVLPGGRTRGSGQHAVGPRGQKARESKPELAARR